MPASARQSRNFIVFPGENRCNVLSSEVLGASGDKVVKYSVAGRCMSPILLPGDELVLDNTEGPVRAGWIMSFRWGEANLTHRAIRCDGGRFWARGDLSDGVQGPVGPEDTIGRVVAIVRNGRRIDLNGERERILGLLRNFTMAGLRAAATNMPGLRSFIETKIMASPALSALVTGAVGAIAGSVELAEIDDPQQKLSGLLTVSRSLRGRQISRLEKDIASGAIRLFSAVTGRTGRAIGSVLLFQGRFRVLGLTWIIHDVQAGMGSKLLGGERLLFESIERRAREEEIAFLIIEPGNSRQAALLESLGYRRISSKIEAAWPKRLRERLSGTRLRYGKENQSKTG